MKHQLQKCLDTLVDLCECSKISGTCLPAEIDSTIDTLRETLAKNATCYIAPADLEEMKKPGIRIVEVSNLPFDAWTVPLYRWG